MKKNLFLSLLIGVTSLSYAQMAEVTSLESKENPIAVNSSSYAGEIPQAYITTQDIIEYSTPASEDESCTVYAEISYTPGNGYNEDVYVSGNSTPASYTPSSSTVDIFSIIPTLQQNLIMIAIAKYEASREKTRLDLYPAVIEALTSKRDLENKIAKLTNQKALSADNEKLLEGYVYLLTENDTVLSNISITQNSLNAQLLSDLKLDIRTIIDQWLHTSNLLSNINIQAIIDDINYFYSNNELY